MKTVLLVVLVAACGKSAGSDADCQALKTTYMAWTDAMTKQALAEDDAEHRAKDEADAVKEHASADANFVGACHRMKLDPTCWVVDMDKAKKASCRDMQHQLDELLYR
jgi:hypothetical protein